MVLYRLCIDETRCMNCGACQDLCPPTAIEFTRAEDSSFYGALFSGHPVDSIEEVQPKSWMMEKPYLPIQERCTGCQICVRECPTNAITVEPDLTKPASLKPKPVVLRTDTKMRSSEADDGYWHPLSEFTKEYLKRPVRSPWSSVAEWKPMARQRGTTQTWRTMPDSERKTTRDLEE